MSRLFLNDERGAVTIDWVALSAGILVFAIIVVFAVMGNSAGYLLDEFEQLNTEHETLADEVSALGSQINLNQ